MGGVLGSYLAHPPRYGVGAAAVPYQSSLPTYLRITDIDDTGRFSPSPRVSVDSPLSGSFVLRVGDLVIARTGASVGKAYCYRAQDGELVFAGFLIKIRPDPRLLDPRYLSHVLQSKPYWDWVTSESMRSGQPGINAQQLARLPVDLPDIQVQKNIADKLSDVDALSSSLERLIAKKRAIKHGMMQELLTGRTRLPGFEAPWGTSTFGDVAVLVKNRVDPSRMSGSVVELEHISQGSGRLLGEADLRCAASLKTVFSPGDVLFGKLRAYLRKYWLADRDGFCSTEIWVIRARSSVAVGKFVRYIVEQDEFIDVASAAHGTHMPRSDWGVVSRFEIRLPPIDEQCAIAKVLMDADRELIALERRVQAARAIRRGMMQELLTGRTRLAVEEDTA